MQDTFTRRDSVDELGSTKNGPSWRAVLGVWGIRGGGSYISSTAPVVTAATIATPKRDETIAITIDGLTNNAGLIFRYRDPDDYWAVVLSPNFGTCSVLRVTSGRTTYVTNLGLVPLALLSRLNVRMSGKSLEFWEQGGSTSSVPKRIVDGTLMDSTTAGLILIGRDMRALRFENFVVSR